MSQLPIVVGVDGSPESLVALKWALEQARMTGAALEVVCAYEVAFSDPYAGTILVQADEIESVAKSELDTLLDQVDTTGVEITATAQPGHAPIVLIDAGKHASMLVVGTHGRSGLSGLLLGSTSRAILHHPPCPVVVVPSQVAR